MRFASLERIRSLAVVGATGLVGREFLDILSESQLSIPNLVLLASEKSQGTTIEVNNREIEVQTLESNSFDDVEIAFFSLPESLTKEYVPMAVEAGALVVDDSSCFRMNPEVPLIVPEVNGSVLREFQGSLVATPNCSTTPLVLALQPLLREFGLRRVVASTYQSVSGAGRQAFDELSEQTAKLLNGQMAEAKAFPHRIAFNCLPLIGSTKDSGYSSEEEKMVNETRKILELPDLRITTTAIRVPTFCGHGLSVNVELEKNFDAIDKVREIFDTTPGLKVLDRPDGYIYPTNVECVGSDDCFVGRIRRDFSVPSGLNFWLIADNLRKGAALNSLQILDTLYKYRRMA